jgi:hypothetical protein
MSIEWIRPSGNKIVTNDHKETILHAEQMGWVRADQEKIEEVIKQPEIDKDLLDQHITAITKLSDKDAISDYIEKVFATKLDKRGGLETFKTKALNFVSEAFLND